MLGSICGVQTPTLTAPFDEILAVLICHPRWLQQLRGGETPSDQSKVKMMPTRRRRSPSAAGTSISGLKQRLQQTFGSGSETVPAAQTLRHRQPQASAAEGLLSRAAAGITVSCPAGGPLLASPPFHRQQHSRARTCVSDCEVYIDFPI